MTDAVIPSWNEDNIEKALMDAQGDLFIAAQLLGHVTALKLDRAIRCSARLQQVFLTIKQVKALPEYDRLSQEALEQEVARRMTVYRSDALDSIHSLATMPIGENSAMAQVKLAAAVRLAGGTVVRESGSDLESTLRELNELYTREAPRIKVTREKMTVELGGEEIVIEGSAQPAT
jgi:stress response protein YsnF